MQGVVLTHSFQFYEVNSGFHFRCDTTRTHALTCQQGSPQPTVSCIGAAAPTHSRVATHALRQCTSTRVIGFGSVNTSGGRCFGEVSVFEGTLSGSFFCADGGRRLWVAGGWVARATFGAWTGECSVDSKFLCFARKYPKTTS